MRISKDQKLEIVRKHLNDGITLRELSEEYGMDQSMLDHSDRGENKNRGRECETHVHREQNKYHNCENAADNAIVALTSHIT